MSPLLTGKLPLLLFALLLLTRASAVAAAAAVTTTEDVPYTTTEDDVDDGSGSGSGSGDGDSGEDDDGDEGDWRENTLIYQIWPRSFQDSDGDGEGDLQGIISRLDYFVDIGVDTIRLSPIYSSPMIDSGYDIDNHTDIDPIFGDFNDFYELVDKAHKKDLKIILDIIPNHSSDEHEWFFLSATDTEPYDDYYIWADGKISGNKLVPPNNWKSAYSDDEGSAWTWHMEKKQWYYHKFHSTEPDLNLRNEDVVQDILDIFDFWLEKGVDGFCICGASYLLENEALLDESSEEEGSDENDDDDVAHTVGLSENADLLYRFREHIDEWAKENNEEPKLLIAEVDELDDDVISYYGNDTHPGIIPLNTILVTKLNKTSDAGDIKDLIEDWMEQLPEGAKTNWMLSNQDNSRAASRLDPELMDGLYMLTLLLPGQAAVYYGEEIGMLNTNVSWEDTIDVKALQESEETYEESTRDPARTPMQWDDSTSAGFSTNETTFLPVNPNYVKINVENQLQHADSDLEAFKKLSILRENPIFTQGDYELDAVNDDNVLVLRRSLGNDTCIVIINFGSSKQTVNLTDLYPGLEEDLQVMLDSSNADVEKDNDEDDDDDIENNEFTLDANAAAVLCDKDDFTEFPFETTTSEDDSTTTEDDDDNEDNDSDDDKDDDKSDDSKEKSKEDDDDDDDDDDGDKDNAESAVPAATTEAPEPNAATAKEAFEFITLMFLALLLLLRSL